MVIYSHQTEDIALGPTATIEESSDNWWAGAEKCFATVALAVTLATAALASQAAAQVSAQPQDEIPSQAVGAGVPYGGRWDNKVQVRLASGGSDELPIFVPWVPREEYWQNPAAPVPAALRRLDQWPLDVQEPPGTVLIGQPDEEVLPLWHPREQFGPTICWWGEDLVTSQVQDEDYWTNSVVPVHAQLQRSLPYLFDSGEGIHHGPKDEDYWQNAVAPGTRILQWPHQWAFDVQEPGILLGQLDEDYWLNWIRHVRRINGSLYWFDDKHDILVELPPAVNPEFTWVSPLISASIRKGRA